VGERMRREGDSERYKHGLAGKEEVNKRI